MSDLRERLSAITFPQRGHMTQSTGSGDEKEATESEQETEHKPPLQRLRSETECCILSKKPVEKILIK